MTRKGSNGLLPLMGQLKVSGDTLRTALGLDIWLLKQLLGLPFFSCQPVTVMNSHHEWRSKHVGFLPPRSTLIMQWESTKKIHVFVMGRIYKSIFLWNLTRIKALGS